MSQAIEYMGDDIIYAVEVVLEDGQTILSRAYNQTDGSHDISADEVELETKDKVGSDYGKVKEEIEFEGITTQGDIVIPFILKSIRNKQFVRIHKINLRTNESESGRYMLSNFSEGFPVGDHRTYSISAALNGSITEGVVDNIPEGAPDELEEVPGEEEGGGV